MRTVAPLALALPVGLLAVALAAVTSPPGWRRSGLRHVGEPPSASQRPAVHDPGAPASQAPEAGGVSAAPTPARTASLPPAAPPAVGSDAAGSALLEAAAAARKEGDLRGTLALLRAAVERAPSVATHAALGGLYLELGAPRAAEVNLRTAVEGDPQNAERWIVLANALALKPDPMAAAEALGHARRVEPGIRIVRDPAGRLARAAAPAR